MITVALPTYNGEKYVAEALQSVLSQEPPAREVLVVDDQSTDGTLEVVRRVGGERVRILLNEHRLGLAGNWNRCVEQSRTDWVAVFHQDDVMLPGHLARHGAVVEQVGPPGDLGMITGAATPVDSAGQVLPESVASAEWIDWEKISSSFFERLPGGVNVFGFAPGAFLNELAWRNPVRCSAVTLWKPAHQKLGGFDGRYKYAVDWDFWIRLAGAYSVAWLLTPPTVSYRWHQESETHRFRVGTLDLDEQRELIETLLAEAGDTLAKPQELRKKGARRLARAYLNRAYQAACVSDRQLQKRCLKEVWRLSPRTLAQVALEPRLLARLVVGKKP